MAAKEWPKAVLPFASNDVAVFPALPTSPPKVTSVSTIEITDKEFSYYLSDIYRNRVTT